MIIISFLKYFDESTSLSLISELVKNIGAFLFIKFDGIISTFFWYLKNKRKLNKLTTKILMEL